MFIFCITILMAACSDSDRCQDGRIEIVSLDDLGCVNSSFNMTVATVKEFELIRNQEDYNIFVDAKCNPEINWLESDLIAGMIGLQKGFYSIESELVMTCNTNRLLLTFTIQLNQTLVAPLISFNAIIPKLKDEQDFFVEVLIKE